MRKLYLTLIAFFIMQGLFINQSLPVSGSVSMLSGKTADPSTLSPHIEIGAANLNDSFLKNYTRESRGTKNSERVLFQLAPKIQTEYKQKNFKANVYFDSAKAVIEVIEGDALNKKQHEAVVEICSLWRLAFDMGKPEIIITSDSADTNGTLAALTTGKKNIIYIHRIVIDRLSTLEGEQKEIFEIFLKVLLTGYVKNPFNVQKEIERRNHLLYSLRKEKPAIRVKIQKVIEDDKAIFGIERDEALLAAFAIRDEYHFLEGELRRVKTLEAVLEDRVKKHYQFLLGERFDHYWEGIKTILTKEYSKEYPMSSFSQITFSQLPSTIGQLESDGLSDIWERLVHAAIWFEENRDPNNNFLSPSETSSVEFMNFNYSINSRASIQAFLAVAEDCVKNNDLEYRKKWAVLHAVVNNSLAMVYPDGYETYVTDSDSESGIFRIVAAFIEKYGFGTLSEDKEGIGGAMDGLNFASEWSDVLVSLRDYPNAWSRLEEIAIWSYENNIDFNTLSEGLEAVDRYIPEGMDALEVAKKLGAVNDYWGEQYSVLKVMNEIGAWGQEIDPESEAGQRLARLFYADDYSLILREMFTIFLEDILLAKPFSFRGQLLSAESVTEKFFYESEFRDQLQVYHLLEAIAVYQIQQQPFIDKNFSEGKIHAWMRRITGFGARNKYTEEDKRSYSHPITEKGAKLISAMISYLDQRGNKFAGNLEVMPVVARKFSLQRFKMASLDNYFKGLSGHVEVHLPFDETLFLKILERGAIINGQANPEALAYLDREYNGSGARDHRPTKFVHFFTDEIKPPGFMYDNDALYKTLLNSRYGFIFAPEFLLENFSFLNNPLCASGDFTVGQYKSGAGLVDIEIPIQAGVVLLPLSEKNKLEKILADMPVQAQRKIFYYQGKNAQEGLEEFKEHMGLKVEGRVQSSIIVSRQPEPVEFLTYFEKRFRPSRQGAFKNDYLNWLSALLVSIKDAPDSKEQQNSLWNALTSSPRLFPTMVENSI